MDEPRIRPLSQTQTQILAREQVVFLKDVKSSGTTSGTFTSGSWQTRTLNTIENAQSWISLLSNQFSLSAGTYEITAYAPAYSVDAHQAKLYNVTDASDTIIGTTEHVGAASTVGTSSVVIGTFTITATKTFELRHKCSTTLSTNGFGLAGNLGVSEVYSTVRIKKVA
jgi:hypothetical protein